MPGVQLFRGSWPKTLADGRGSEMVALIPEELLSRERRGAGVFPKAVMLRVNAV